MGKKRIIKKGGDDAGANAARTLAIGKKRFTEGVVHIHSTYNNTLITLTDVRGDAVFQSSSGALGFSGSKKGTPYAASKAAEVVAQAAEQIGVKDLVVRVHGVGSGRESAVRLFAQRGFSIHSIADVTPIPHGTPRLPKPRRV